MSVKRMGAACVLGDDHKLLGLVVDGDVRRALQQGGNIERGNRAIGDANRSV